MGVRKNGLLYISLVSFLWSNLKKNKKVEIFKLLFLMLTCGFAELISLSSVIPFLIVLTNPSKLTEIKILSPFVEYIGFENQGKLILFITLFFLSATAFTMIVRLYNIWLNGQTCAAIGSDISDRVYTNILYKNYSWHLRGNSSDYISELTINVNSTITFIASSLRILTYSIIIISIVFGLLVINPQVALVIFFAFSLAYISLAFSIRRKISNNGKILEKSNKRKIKLLQEGLQAIREVILSNNQSYFSSIYKNTDKPTRYIEAQNQFYAASPRFILESVSLFLIAIIAYFLTTTSIDPSEIIAILGTFAVGSQKLLPAMQGIYNEWAILKTYLPAVKSIAPLIKEDKITTKQIEANSFKKYKLKDSIKFKNLSFSYSERGNDVFRDINISIQKGQKIGIIGETGGGKSTLINLLMGLLEPTSGEILVDKKKLVFNDYQFMYSWRSSISHVPQDIFLADATIAENIAFGLNSRKIEMGRVIKAAEQAKIHDFIQSLNMGYESYIGERGVRLSGGQKQRLGIARALYQKSNLIILDEATSALDFKTEEKVINSIHELYPEVTLIMIAHRLSTLKMCDFIYKVESSNIVNV
ncbi:ABC transporter ATP-binding protein/permease [Prochlorococcus sp. AH-716-K03]|nr:ABC transporter ATP-binding protein/permease [Prochlorococcus sp. AH-716-K03]